MCLFVILFGGSLFLLFRFNVYHKSIGFTSASTVSGKVLEGVSYVNSYMSLGDKNRELARYNIVLQQRIDALRYRLASYEADSLIEGRFSDARMIEARVVNKGRRAGRGPGRRSNPRPGRICKPPPAPKPSAPRRRRRTRPRPP